MRAPANFDDIGITNDDIDLFNRQTEIFRSDLRKAGFMTLATWLRPDHQIKPVIFNTDMQFSLLNR